MSDKASKKKLSLPVAMVNNVYFPSQKLTFKINDPTQKILSLKQGFYGVVAKKSENGLKSSLDEEVKPQDKSIAAKV